MVGQGMTVEFDGPGPFELPMCSRVGMIASTKRGFFFLTLDVEGKRQRIVAPISVQALTALQKLVDHALKNRGIGMVRH